MDEAPDTAEEWELLRANLAQCLSALEEDEFLVLDFKRAVYYVQFAAQGRFGMRAEAACNTYIDPPEARLSADDYRLMEQLGWHRATTLPPEAGGDRSPDDSPNFHVDPASPIDYLALATLAVETFRLVYRVKHPGRLKYKAFASNGTQIRFPTLRIMRSRD